eukprot:gene22104-26533_t
MLFAEPGALNTHKFLQDLGIEPTGNRLDGALLARLFADRNAPLKAALLDQKLIAGLGNIYVSAGGSSLKDYRQADGELGYFQHSFSVYDREGEPCPRPACDGTIARIVQSGRSTFFCPICQH